MTFRALDELRAVRDLRDVPSTVKIVLVALILRADERGQCFPSFETLSADAGLSVRCTKTTVAKLASAGHVSAERRSVEGRTIANLYVVHVVHTGVIDVHPGVNEVPPAGGVHDVHEGGDPGAPPGVHDVHTICPQELPRELPKFALTRPEPGSKKRANGKRRSKKRERSPCLRAPGKAEGRARAGTPVSCSCSPTTMPPGGSELAGGRRPSPAMEVEVHVVALSPEIAASVRVAQKRQDMKSAAKMP